MLVFLSSLVGGLFAAVPQIVKIFADKQDKTQELQIMDRQIELAKIQGQTELQEIKTQSATIDLVSARSFATTSKVRWIDGLISSVRPIVTYQFMGLYMVYKGCVFISFMVSGLGIVPAIQDLWTSEDYSMLSGILAFWFVDRTFRKNDHGM